MTTKITNVSNPAALGAEVSDDESTFQLVVLRGTSTVRFSLKGDDGWSPMTAVVNPDRFGPIPTDAKSLMAYARRFVDGDES